MTGYILLLYVLKEAFEYVVQYLNLSHLRKAGLSVPQEFEGIVDEAVLRKTLDYEAEKMRFRFISGISGNIIAIAFVFGGLLNIYNSWIASLDLPFIASGWFFFLLLFYAGEFLSVPFSLYSIFKIENKYGFNTMTLGLWMSDFIKSLVISTIVLSLVIVTGLWIIQLSPHAWWLLVWGFLLVLGIFMMYVSPYVIEPLFSKFTPVEDKTLREKIVVLADKAGIRAERVLRVDASKRSRHTNAYFTGIGKTKRIVLYDTLLERMGHNEILSVLAHEAGHWKKRHLLKGIAFAEIISLSALYLCYRLVRGDLLLSLFRISDETLFVKFALIGFLVGIVAAPLKPLMNYFSRRYERQADGIAYELTGDAESLTTAFVKLSKENLSNLYPHPLYVTMYYSHPPILERIRYIREMAKENDRAHSPPLTC